MALHIGDIVQLHGGGPVLTVFNVNDGFDKGTQRVTCLWFDATGNVQTHCFLSPLLKPADGVP